MTDHHSTPAKQELPIPLRDGRAMKRHIGTMAVAVVLAITGLPAAGVAASGWYRVEFGAVITGEDRAAIDAAGGRAPQYVPENTYLTWLDDGAVERVRALAAVTDVRPVEAGEKVDAELLAAGDDVVPVSALVYGPEVDSARDQLDAVSDVAQVLPFGRRESLLAELLVVARAADLGAIASVREVLHVGPAVLGLFPEDEGTAQIVASNLDADRAAPVPGYEVWLDKIGLSGEGVTVSIVDTGVDEKHPDLAGRVVKNVDYTTTGEEEDSFGHGTHVGGIVGAGAVALRDSGGVKDDDGFLYGLGVAPAVELLDQNAIGTTVLEWPPPYGFARLTQDGLVAGAVGWNASWTTGEGTGAGYLATAATLDALVRDGNPETPEAEPFSMVFSAGNSGPDLQTLTAPKEAKNIISVASTRSQRSGDIDEVSSFSSRGPARDGRLLPTVSAPGQTVVSTRSLPASAVCNQPPTDGNSLGLYGLCSGTSMAAPHVTGAVALITEWWRDRTGSDPSPAMVKALLVNTATDMVFGDIPNPHEGWGRVNLGSLFNPSIERLFVDQSVILTEPGDSRVFKIKPEDPRKPLKVTLVWSDVPGTPQADKTLPALVNDLDLEVRGRGLTYHGNNFSGGASVPDGSPDRLNNVESVYLFEPGRATHRITVRAVNLPGDGVPNFGDTTDQDFALVISNGTLDESPDSPPPPPVLGEPYASFTFDADAEGWTASGVPTWSRSAPGTKDGSDDPATAAFAIEGPTEYIDLLDAHLTSPPITTDSGATVLQFWVKLDIESGFDFVRVEWSADGMTWRSLADLSGRNNDYPSWEKVLLGFESPGGDIRVRFRFESDFICSALTPLCGEFTGARVDEVIVGRQAD